MLKSCEVIIMSELEYSMEIDSLIYENFRMYPELFDANLSSTNITNFYIGILN